MLKFQPNEHSTSSSNFGWVVKGDKKLAYVTKKEFDKLIPYLVEETYKITFDNRDPQYISFSSKVYHVWKKRKGWFRTSWKLMGTFNDLKVAEEFLEISREFPKYY